jgi:hypothetical protein
MRMSWAGHLARIGERRDACRVLVVKPSKRRWEDNVENFELDIRKIGWDVLSGFIWLCYGLL